MFLLHWTGKRSQDKYHHLKIYDKIRGYSTTLFFMAQLVKLMWVTPEAEHLITDMARVSAPSNQGNYDTAPRLIKYLIKHRHWSPFEMASMCVEINTTRDIAAQIIRHRSFSFQEFCMAGSTQVYFARRSG